MSVQPLQPAQNSTPPPRLLSHLGLHFDAEGLPTCISDPQTAPSCSSSCLCPFSSSLSLHFLYVSLPLSLSMCPLVSLCPCVCPSIPISLAICLFHSCLLRLLPFLGLCNPPPPPVETIRGLTPHSLLLGRAAGPRSGQGAGPEDSPWPQLPPPPETCTTPDAPAPPRSRVTPRQLGSHEDPPPLDATLQLSAEAQSSATKPSTGPARPSQQLQEPEHKALNFTMNRSTAPQLQQPSRPGDLERGPKSGRRAGRPST